MKALIPIITLFLLTSCNGGGSDAPTSLETEQPIVTINMASLNRTGATSARLECSWAVTPEGTPTIAAFIKWWFLEETIQGFMNIFEAYIPVKEPGEYTMDLDPAMVWDKTAATLYVKTNFGNFQQSISYKD